MRLTIRIKMFLVLLVSNIVIITSMYFFILASLESGFTGYLDDIELQQLQRVSTQLGDLFKARKTFSFLKQDEQLVRKLEDLLFAGEDLYVDYPETWFEDEAAYFDIPGFYVLDSEKNTVIGHWDEDSELLPVPIEVDGRIVGWVGYSEMEELVDTELFIEAQSRDYLIITAITLLCSALFALGAAYHFEKPVKALAKGTRRLTSGRYDTRVDVRSYDEIGDLTRDFNSLADKLEESERARRKWVEDISHELKTPLTLLSGEIEAVRDGIRPLSEITVDSLGKDIDHLKVLVNDLNDLWRTEMETMSLCKTRTSLLPIIWNSLEKFRQQFDNKKISIDFEDLVNEDVVVYGDSKRLIQLYDNVFQNSLRYTDSGGRLRLSIGIREGYVVTDIQDTEPGVGPSDIQHLFERLYRAEPSRNREFGGSGIGLALCRNIVFAHDGAIHAFASPLGGLGLKIELPLLAEKHRKGKDEAADTRC